MICVREVMTNFICINHNLETALRARSDEASKNLQNARIDYGSKSLIVILLYTHLNAADGSIQRVDIQC